MHPVPSVSLQFTGRRVRGRKPAAPRYLSEKYAPAEVVSAATGAGLDALVTRMAEMRASREVEFEMLLPHAAGRLRALLFDHGVVLEERVEEGGDRIRARLPESLAGPFRAYEIHVAA